MMTAREKQLLALILNPDARRVLIALSKGKSSAAEITEASGIGRRSVQIQLEKLEKVGLVKKRMRKRGAQYELDAKFVADLTHARPHSRRTSSEG